MTAGCIGAFYLFELLDIFFLAESEDDSTNEILEQFKLLLMCTPYLIDFLAGIITLQLFISLLKQQEQKVEAAKPLEEQLLPALDRYASNIESTKYWFCF